jgi:hypothetical protein
VFFVRAFFFAFFIAYAGSCVAFPFDFGVRHGEKMDGAGNADPGLNRFAYRGCGKSPSYPGTNPAPV